MAEGAPFVHPRDGDVPERPLQPPPEAPVSANYKHLPFAPVSRATSGGGTVKSEGDC